MFNNRFRLRCGYIALLMLAGCQSQPQQPVAPVGPTPVIREPVQPETPWVAPAQVETPIQVNTTTPDPFNVEEGLSVDSALSSDELYEKARQLMEGTPSDENKQAAVVLLNQAAELGNAEAMRVLGLLKLKEGPDQRALAIALLEGSAANSIKAMRQLGILYGNLSQPHLDNPQKALSYLQKASDLGDGESSFYLGRLLARAGRNDEGKRLIALASEQGFVKGGGISKKADEQRSADLMRSYALQRQAMKGDPESMYQFAQLLLAGKAQGSLAGYDQSAQFEAYYWLKRAALMGDIPSATKLTEMSEVEAQMALHKMTYQKLDKALTGTKS
ncbi:hypothetical protein [Pseudomonas serbica]|jgi:TPR repeat protein|uniref:hypothetical protein n=1 Tax=Pseudomonas serbica TaxID=2965074 RepID=UPI00237A8905|nr:hypothetical protein [Pseudomonas serbica]